MKEINGHIAVSNLETKKHKNDYMGQRNSTEITIKTLL